MVTAIDQNEREIVPAVRAGFFVPLAIGTGLQVVVLYVLSGFSEAMFAWTFRSPLSAAVMGAGYCGGLAMLISAARLRRWVDVRVSYGSALLLVTLMPLVVVAHRPDTHLVSGLASDRINAWIFVLSQALAVLAGLALLVPQLRAPGVAAPSYHPRMVVNVLPIAVVGAVGIAVGLLALLLPGVTAAHWPWPVSELDVSALGVWALVVGAGSLGAIRDIDPARQRTGAISYLFTGSAAVLAMVRYSGEVAWSSAWAWLFLFAMAAMALLGLLGWSMAGPAERRTPRARL